MGRLIRIGERNWLTSRDNDEGVCGGLAEVGLSSLLHLSENYGGVLLMRLKGVSERGLGRKQASTYEFALLALVPNRDSGLAVFVHDTEGQVLHIDRKSVV